MYFLWLLRVADLATLARFATPCRRSGQLNGGKLFTLTNQIIHLEAGTYNEFIWQGILGLKTPSHDYYSDDDVSAQCHSDSDILETVEKADSVEFLDDNSSTSAGSKGDLDKQVTFK